MTGPIHIKARKEDIASRVIVAGDPARVEQLASMLEDVKLVNKNRGIIIYSGKYKGIPISIAMHGIGAPFASLVLEELIMLGAKVVIRLGSCGAMVKGLRIGDVVIPTSAAYYPGGFFYQYLRECVCMAAAPHFEVLKALVEEANKHGLKYVIGPVISSDAFYAEDPEFIEKWSSRGIVAVEMECAALFMLGTMRNIKTGALLIVSDSPVEKTGFASAEELRPYVERAGRAVLEAIIKVEV
ncbi:MAG TPA: nucleoside phosphorylase [Ignisphaera aggregans]|uniref:Nucleoside phosphorylase n=1 Tax=Ignisphaera aggregans TaxID=334771 RepID=A0A833DTS3_9CREN|nr:nucleoside phosphorylase [Ignisphaera aggregans]